MKSYSLKTPLILAVIVGFTLTMPNLFAVQIVDYSNYEYTSGFNLLEDDDLPQNLDLNNASAQAADYDTLPNGNASATVYAAGSASAKMFGLDTNNVGGGSNNAALRNAVLWQKADFLNSGNSQAVNLDATSSFNLTWGGRDKEPIVAARWLILQDGTLYVSDETKILQDPGDDNSNTVSSGNFTTMQWASVDLTNDITADPGSFGSISSLNDIEGVGFYFTSDDAVTGNPDGDTTDGFRWTEFSATATVIPEPGAGALLLFAAGGLLLFRRRRA